MKIICLDNIDYERDYFVKIRYNQLINTDRLITEK
jgi:hypothetical protein